MCQRKRDVGGQKGQNCLCFLVTIGVGTWDGGGVSIGLKPESSGLFELGDQVSGDVGGHKAVHAPDEAAPDEDGRDEGRRR